MKFFLVGFLVLWAYACFALGFSASGGFFFVLVIFSYVLSAEGQASLRRFFDWLSLNLMVLAEAALMGTVAASIFYFLGLPYRAMPTIACLLFAGGALTKRVGRSWNNFPRDTINAVIEIAQPGLGLVLGTIGLICGLAFAAANVISNPTQWPWLPVYFLEAFFCGLFAAVSLIRVFGAGWTLASPERSKPMDAKIADPDELKKAGLSRDL